jgi:hypothetical protein
MPHRKGTSVTLVVLAITLATASACASRPGGSAGSSTDPTTVLTSGPSTSSATSSGSVAATPTGTATATASATAVDGAACGSADLTASVLRGSGAGQTQFATVQFTNRSTRTCTLTGFPGVSLYLTGQALGAPAERSTSASLTVSLLPGTVASAGVTDYSSCDAPTSDTIRVYAPNLTTYVDLPLGLRGCRLVVDPVTLG